MLLEFKQRKLSPKFEVESLKLHWSASDSVLESFLFISRECNCQIELVLRDVADEVAMTAAALRRKTFLSDQQLTQNDDARRHADQSVP
jgi:hypothetical protein